MSAHEEGHGGGINLEASVLAKNGTKLSLGLGYSELFGFKFSRSKKSNPKEDKAGVDELIASSEVKVNEPRPEKPKHRSRSSSKSGAHSLLPTVKHFTFEQKYETCKLRTKVSGSGAKFFARCIVGGSPDAVEENGNSVPNFQEEEDDQEETSQSNSNRPKENELRLWLETEIQHQKNAMPDF